MKQYKLTYELTTPKMIQDGPFRGKFVCPDIISKVEPVEEDGDIIQELYQEIYEGLGTRGNYLLRR